MQIINPTPALLFARRLTEELPHRGSTTQQERQALDMVCATLKKHGIQQQREQFRASASAYRAGLIFATIQILASVFYVLSQNALASFALAALGLVYILADSALIDTPFSRKAQGENVWAEIKSRENPTKTIVLAAHVDTHRTPVLFSSATWLRGYRLLMPGAIGLSISAMLTYWFPVVGFWLAILHAILMLLVAVLMCQADSTPYSNGANDNASGAGALMAMANHYKKNPLRHTRLIVLWTGCEEVGAYGSRSWAKKHRQDYPGAYWISLDTLAGDNSTPRFSVSEQFLLKTTSDPELIFVASDLAAAYSARPVKLESAYTDSAPAARNGFRTISILAMTPDDQMPGWHTVSDTNLNVTALGLSLNYAAAIVEKIDEGVSQ